MDRRYFFKAFAGIVGGIALEQAIPFNRVWSFPSKIVIPRSREIIVNNFLMSSNSHLFAVGDVITVASLDRLFQIKPGRLLTVRPSQV